MNNKRSVALPVVDIPGTDFKFGDEVTVLLPHTAQIWGYTTEHGKSPTGLQLTKTKLIVQIDGQAYTVSPDDCVTKVKA